MEVSHVREAVVGGDVDDPQRRAGRVGEVAPGLVEPATADGRGVAVFVPGEQLVQQPHRDAEAGRRCGRGTGRRRVRCSSMSSSGLGEQPAVPLADRPGRLGLVERDREQPAGVPGEPGRRCRGELAGVDRGERVPDGRTDAVDGADPGRGRSRPVKVALSSCSGICRVSWEKSSPNSNENGRVVSISVRSPGWVTATRPSWVVTPSAAQLEVGVVAGLRRPGDVGLGPAHSLRLRLDPGQVELVKRLLPDPAVKSLAQP